MWKFLSFRTLKVTWVSKWVKEPYNPLHPKSILQSYLLLYMILGCVWSYLLSFDMSACRGKTIPPILQLYCLEPKWPWFDCKGPLKPKNTGQTDSRYNSKNHGFSKIFQTVPEVFLSMVGTTERRLCPRMRKKKYICMNSFTSPCPLDTPFWSVFVLKDVVSTLILSQYLRSLGGLWAKERVVQLTYFLKAIYFGSAPLPCNSPK